MESSLHDQDYNLWLEQTAIALRNQDIERMDWENLVAEIEDIGASQKRALALRSYMYRLIEHIFKLQYIDSELFKSGKKKNEGDKKVIRPTFAEFKQKALANSEVKKEYDALSPVYKLRKQLIALRTKAGLTQEELAEKLNTKKSNISRLENVNSLSSPKLSTIEQYADAVGYKVEINFVPISQE